MEKQQDYISRQLKAERDRIGRRLTNAGITLYPDDIEQVEQLCLERLTV